MELHEEIISSFPRLKDGGGYELLRTKPENNRVLFVIPSPAGGYTVNYLKSIVNQAKVYIRPIQQNLSTFPIDDLNYMVSKIIYSFIGLFTGLYIT